VNRNNAGSSGDGVAFIDGEFVPIEEARIPIMDWGLLRSDATYDVAHVWKGRFFRLEDHLDRFLRSIENIHMKLPHSRDGIRSILLNCVRRSGLRDAYVEMICTRGLPPSGTRDPRRCENRFYAFVVPFIWIADPEMQERGVHLIVSGVRRIPPESVDPKVKNYHWMDLVRGLYEAFDRGGDTAVLLDEDGCVTEGPGFNLFVFRNGRLATPKRGVLEGITRKTVIGLAGELEVQMDIGIVRAEQVLGAEEVFLTSTAGGVMPVTRVDGKAVADGRPGSLTLAIRQKYWAWHEDPRYSSAVSYE
jgi:branched-chain amino acid aminotransferase